jgi:hypothetical protein
VKAIRENPQDSFEDNRNVFKIEKGYRSFKRELWIRGQKKLSIFKYLKAKEKFCEECSTATGRAKFFF